MVFATKYASLAGVSQGTSPRPWLFLVLINDLRLPFRYLGKIVSADGYTMDPADVAAVAALKETKP